MDRVSDLAKLIAPYRKWIAAGAAVLAFVAILALARGIGGQDMSLLYAGLDDASAGEVVAALEAQGATYEVRNSAIWVASADRDILRLRLAGEGLPASGPQGYELLDNLSGFGTTAQMFDAAYWRAKEGELARTVLASPNIRAARVHISAGNERPFSRDQKATAAVTVTTSVPPSGAQVQALQHLIASAVTGLSPDEVSIIDTSAGLLSGSEATPTTPDVTEALRASVERLLEARVGYGNAIVEVAVDTITERESISERIIDPESRVAISSEVQENSNQSSDSASAVTVASNLPTGDAAGQGQNASNSNESRTLTNYEISETHREVIKEPGAIRRLSVAVLINDPTTTAADGTVASTPRDATELDDLRALVESAVGFDSSRGDVITLRSLPFEPQMTIGSDASAPFTQPLNLMRLIQLGVLALVTLVLGLFVVRPILTPRAITELSPPRDITPNGGLVLENDQVRPVPTPVDRLRGLIGDRQKDGIQILQTWIEEARQTERAEP